MSVRDLVAGPLAALDGFTVIDTARTPERLNGPTVLVYREQVTNHTTYLEHTVAIWVLDPHQDPGAVEDPLDGWLDAVLTTLSTVANITWTTAERGVFDNTWHSYRITTTVTTKEP